MAMDLNAKAAYIRGLMTGMEFDADSKNGKVIAAMMDLLEEMAAQVTEHDDALDQVYDELETLDQDVDDIVSDLYADDDDEDEDDEDDDSTMYEVTCPNCGQISTLDEETLMDPEGDLVCPHCGATFDVELEGGLRRGDRQAGSVILPPHNSTRPAASFGCGAGFILGMFSLCRGGCLHPPAQFATDASSPTPQGCIPYAPASTTCLPHAPSIYTAPYRLNNTAIPHRALAPAPGRQVGRAMNQISSQGNRSTMYRAPNCQPPNVRCIQVSAVSTAQTAAMHRPAAGRGRSFRRGSARPGRLTAAPRSIASRNSGFAMKNKKPLNFSNCSTP